MRMDDAAKTVPEDVAEGTSSTEETPPTMSGKQPSPYTLLRQKANPPEQGEQRNCDAEYVRRDFYALINRAVNATALRSASAKQRTSVP
jgi:hypothetical protein